MLENNKPKGSGWFEKPDPISEKSPIHQAVAHKKEFSKDFGNGKNRTTIAPKEDKSVARLHFRNILEKDFGNFADTTLKFTKQGNDLRSRFISHNNDEIKITITNEDECIVAEVRTDLVISYHDFLLGENPNFNADAKDLLPYVTEGEQPWQK